MDSLADVPEPFAEQVSAPGWQAAAHAWIESTLAAHGRTVTGPIEQRRVRPWSTQLVAPTSDGPAWFKANCPGLAHEAALHAELGRLVPDRVDAPLGIDADRGWLLTCDRGPTLAERGEPDAEAWLDIVREAARLQRRLAGDGAVLLATGMPNCSSPTVLDRFDWLLGRLAALDPAHPSHLGDPERDEFVAARPRIVAAVDTLAAGAVPSTLNHGDTHPNNLLIVDGSPRLFDFGDAQWAHPFESLWTVWSWLTRVSKLPYEPVFAAYADEWRDLVDPADFDEQLRAAMVTLPVNRALTWWHSVEFATSAELADWGDAPLSQLRHVRDAWPWQ